MPTKNISFLTPEAAEQESISRRRSLAEAMQKSALEPIQAQSFNGIPSPISWTQGLAKMLQGYQGGQAMRQADEQAKALATQGEQRRQADMSMLAQALSGRQAQPGGLTEDASGNVTPVPATPATSPVQSIGQVMPMMSSGMQPMAMQALMGAQQRQDQQEFQRRQAQEGQAFRSHEAELARQAATERATAERTFREQQARQASLDREGMLRMSLDARQDQRPPVAVVGHDGKPVLVPASEAAGKQPFDKKAGAGLPPAALKMQNELLEEASIAGNIQSDLAAIHGQLATGELNVGPVSNLVNRARNAVGFSNEQSQNFNTFETTLKRLQNDSLRLNKGVQTEGDAQRAWAELMGGIRDPEVVRKRLEEIQDINQRAAILKKLQIDTIRSNFGLDSMDTSPFTNQPAAVRNAGGQDRRQEPRGGKTRVVNY